MDTQFLGNPLYESAAGINIKGVKRTVLVENPGYIFRNSLIPEQFRGYITRHPSAFSVKATSSHESGLFHIDLSKAIGGLNSEEPITVPLELEAGKTILVAVENSTDRFIITNTQLSELLEG